MPNFASDSPATLTLHKCLTYLLADKFLTYFFQDNFVEVLQSSYGDEFARLFSVDDVVSLLASDDLNVPDERSVFDAVLTWLKYDLTSRRKYAVRLLSLVKLPLLSAQVCS